MKPRETIAGLKRSSRPLRRLLYALGIPGGIGLALMVAAGLSAVMLMHAKAPAPPAPPAPPVVEAGGQAGVLTAPHELDSAVRLLFEIARDRQLELLEGEYRLSAGTDARYQTYQLVMPLKGSYGNLRSFLAACLRANPRLALDAIEFRREQISDETLLARVKFSLFLAPK